MMVDDLRKIYDEWNQKKIVFENFNNFIEITTPFVDMHHDYIQLYFYKQNENEFVITDDGYIMNELEMLGIDIKSSKKRSEYLNRTLKIFGVSLNVNTDDLYITFDNINDYPEQQHRLIQCILRVSDMLMTSRNSVISIFTEEITSFFEDNDVPFSSGLNITGVSGKAQNFDFVINRFRKRNEKLIKAINSPSPDNYVYPLFSWMDIKDIREKADFIILANDTNKPISDKFITPFKNYSVEVLAWSKRNEWVKQFQIS